MSEYTRTLGYGAVRYLLGGGSGALIAITGGRVTPVDFADLADPRPAACGCGWSTSRPKSYEVARSYMIRLEPDDLREPELSRLAAHTNLAAADFKARFSPAVAATIGARTPRTAAADE